MKTERAEETQAWHSLPLCYNPWAILPLCLAGFGSLCWQAVAIFMGWSRSRSEDRFWDVIILVGVVFLLLGFVGSLVYRHYKVAAFALLVSLLSPPLWFWLLILPFTGFNPYDYSYGSPVVLWLYFQIPLVALALWLSPWSRRTKARAARLGAVGLAGFFLFHTVQGHQEVAAAPHVSSEYLSSAYEVNIPRALKRLDGKRVVVTGVIFDANDGLIGGGEPYRMSSNIECDGLLGADRLSDGQTVSIIGTCDGKDKYGMIHLANCRVIE